MMGGCASGKPFWPLDQFCSIPHYEHYLFCVHLTRVMWPPSVFYLVMGPDQLAVKAVKEVLTTIIYIIVETYNAHTYKKTFQ